MTYISCYDDDEKEVEAICDSLDITECEFVEAVVEAIKSGDLIIENYV